MIKNEQQYRVTTAQIEKFERAVAQLEHHPTPADPTDPLLRRIQLDALRSQLTDLRAERDEFDELRSGNTVVLRLASFADLPAALIKARIAAGLTQRDLADRLHLKEQQIQRYEATEYASASLTRVRQVIDALGVDIREEIVLPGRAPGTV
jgi:ribosome-binding protein aMBF1 (putative translation factor)